MWGGGDFKPWTWTSKSKPTAMSLALLHGQSRNEWRGAVWPGFESWDGTPFEKQNGLKHHKRPAGNELGNVACRLLASAILSKEQISDKGLSQRKRFCQIGKIAKCLESSIGKHCIYVLVG